MPHLPPYSPHLNRSTLHITLLFELPLSFFLQWGTRPRPEPDRAGRNPPTPAVQVSRSTTHTLAG